MQILLKTVIVTTFCNISIDADIIFGSLKTRKDEKNTCDCKLFSSQKLIQFSIIIFNGTFLRIVFYLHLLIVAYRYKFDFPLNSPYLHTHTYNSSSPTRC